ncbi:type IV secretory system conjugative DNA transfer family protein, partial [Escherichia coli]|uniref:type IV secretory system conjugative DNA transfer family protein n=1 Tax=Escherichia coli TaxID=562 RepID=UPI00193155E7
KGKTSGLLIPNLAFPEPQGWGGPAVVLDPKGEVYRSVAARRRALGRRVVCLDPMKLAGGTDRWNPLQSRDPDDVLYLQSTALALLAGCANLAPEYEQPVAPVPQSYASTVGASTPGREDLPPWRDYFTDPLLQRLIETALRNNRDLRVAA